MVLFFFVFFFGGGLINYIIPAPGPPLGKNNSHTSETKDFIMVFLWFCFCVFSGGGLIILFPPFINHKPGL